MALINLRNALMSGKRLPYDAEVEYLESTGTQWIDTGVYGDLDTVAEFRAAATANDALYPVFGARISYYQKALAVYNGSDVGYKYTASYDNIRPGNLNLVSDISADVGAWVDFHIGKSMSMGSWQKDTTSYASSFTTAHTLCLFAWNQNGTITCGKYRVSYLKIWQDGVLVRDFIPVRKGTVGYLYDRVSGKLFGNAGTGDFVLGPDVVPVEYIESHGTEYIDTGVNGSQNLRTTFDYQLIYSGTAPLQQGLFGCYTNMMKYHLYCSGVSPSAFQVGMGDNYINTIPVDNVRHSIEFNNGAVSIDENVVATFAPYGNPTTHTLLLFALHNASGGLYSMMPMRKWRVQMWDNGTPVRDYVPIRVGTDATSWEGTMMDVLTRRIYRNAGTGAFTYGNDLKYPIPAA